MIRVGFLVGFTDSNWLGGTNYLRNLLTAVRAVPDRRTQTVVLAAPDADEATLAGFAADEVIRTPLVARRDPRRLAGRLMARLTGFDPALAAACRKYGIDVLSHTLPAGKRSRLRVISWIPDFQERHIPGFFSPEEIALRQQGHRLAAELATIVMLSSNDARGDFLAAFPDAAAKTRVVPFVSTAAPAGTRSLRSLEELRREYDFDGDFFYLPNQFWIHKNHKVVIDALAELKARGRRMLVLCSGHTGDYRHAGHFSDLQAQIRERGVEAEMRILGLIPYPDVTALAHHCMALINPSLFEGWSTTVEEAKSAGKRIILSDIPVHREQAPERGLYFPAEDPRALADRMIEVADSFPQDEAGLAERAAAALPGRVQAFGRAFEAIACEAAAVGPR